MLFGEWSVESYECTRGRILMTFLDRPVDLVGPDSGSGYGVSIWPRRELVAEQQKVITGLAQRRLNAVLLLYTILFLRT